MVSAEARIIKEDDGTTAIVLPRASKVNPYPFCVDCKHCTLISAERQAINDKSYWYHCAHAISPVTGDPDAMTCNEARGRFQRGIEGLCGLEGRLFEARY